MPGTRPARASVLVVEDDPDVARGLMESLEYADYRVWHAIDGRDARAQIDRARPDLIMLDLMLPDVDGLVLCSLLKSLADVPIIVCSGTSRRSDPILALKLGADDFVRKPYDLEDLLARIEAVLRRASTRSGRGQPSTPVPAPRYGEVRVAALAVETGRRRATLGGEPLVLTPTEFRLLSVLAAHAEQILSREQLAREVWGYADASNGRTIDVHVRRLRVKLSQGRVPGPSIVAVRSLGYRMTADIAAITAA
ncbi:MAG TPA: response regulator transcription factor [Chloroflexota bacterium]|nr:response regulator transcription factor [Chloroflexota bacterium]